jgi:phenylalanyl-tRNA synthetase beta chain
MVEGLGAALGVSASSSLPAGPDTYIPAAGPNAIGRGGAGRVWANCIPTPPQTSDWAGAFCWPRSTRIDLLSAIPETCGAVRSLPKYPAVIRDLAVTVPSDRPAGPMLALVREAGGELLEAAEIFDIYEGAQLGEGLKSVAFSLTFRSADRTLTDDEAGEAFDAIVKALGDRFGAGLRK